MEQPDEHYSLVGGNLVITNPRQKKHAGTYICVAKNIYGTVISKEARVKFGCECVNPAGAPHGLWWCKLFCVPAYSHIHSIKYVKVRLILSNHSYISLSLCLSYRGVPSGGKRPSVCEGGTGGCFVVCPSKILATYVNVFLLSSGNSNWMTMMITADKPLPVFSFPEEVTYRWIYNEFPVFLPTDRRRFVSQKTGNLYISKVEAQDAGNYSCFVSSPIIGKSVFSKFIPLIPLPPEDGEWRRAVTKRKDVFILCMTCVIYFFL